MLTSNAFRHASKQITSKSFLYNGKTYGEDHKQVSVSASRQSFVPVPWYILDGSLLCPVAIDAASLRRVCHPCIQQRLVGSQEEIQARTLTLVTKHRLKNFPLISSPLFKRLGVIEDSNQTSSMILLSNSVMGAKPYSTALPMRLYWPAFPVASRTKRQVRA